MKISPKRIDRIFREIPSKRILVIGDIMLDEYIWGVVERISPEAPVPVVDVKEETFRLGGAGNVVRNLSSLDAGVLLCSVTGNDSYGSMIRKLLKDEKIPADGLLKDDKRRTIVKTRIIAHTQQVVRIDKEDRGIVSGDVSKAILALIRKAIRQVDAVIVSDYGKGLVSQKLMDEVMSQAGKAGILVSVDPKERNFAYYKNAGVITPNTKELAFGAGMQIAAEKDMVRAANRIFDMLDCRMLLATRGSLGMTLFEGRDRVTHIPAAAKKVFDVTGAGDTVISVFTLAMAAGAVPSEAAMIANIAAGMVVGEIGAATVSLDSLRRGCLEEIGG